MNAIKILLVGDLRYGMNYGAIATTESLIDLIRKTSPDSELRIIDSRSFKGNTPVDGFPQYDLSSFYDENQSIKYKLRMLTKKVGLYDLLRPVWRKLTRQKPIDQSCKVIPARLEDYNLEIKAALEGRKWMFERKQIEWADIILINSEGNIVNGTDAYGYYRYGGRYVLFCACLAKCVFHRPCWIINHTVDPKNRDIVKIISSIYPRMDGIYVREKMSAQFLRSIGFNDFRYVPDALWSHDFSADPLVKVPKILNNFDFTKPFICLGDSSGISNAYNHVKWDVVATYTKLIHALRKICPRILFVDGYSGDNDEIRMVIEKNKIPSVNLRNCSYHELYYVLSKANIFISGRWHASIMALLGHTPILLWGSDSHKTEALYREIDYPYEFFDVAALPLNVDRVVKEAKKIMRASHEHVWEKVEWLKHESLKNTDMLRG